MKNAAVMLVIKDGLILSVSRKNDPTKWGLVGGKQEPNETLLAAAIRETKEETSVVVTDAVYLYRREEPRDRPEGEDFNCYAYYATAWSGEPKSSEEGEIAWLTKEELTGSKGAFAEYNKNTLTEFRKLFPEVLI